MTQTDFENQHPRGDAGKFVNKPQSAPEIQLVEPGFQASPLTESELAFARRGHHGAVAYALHERTGWPVLTVSVGDGWTYSAVQMLDGRVLDVTGASASGEHIMTDPFILGSFEPEETREYGAPALVEKDASELLDHYDSDALPEARSIAAKLMTWVGAEDVPGNVWVIEGDDHEVDVVEAESEEEALDIAASAFAARYDDDVDPDDLSVLGSFRGDSDDTESLIFVPRDGDSEKRARRALDEF